MILLHLPFHGEWFVRWGGRTKKQNQHVVVRNQRRAVDFLICDPQGRSHEGRGSRNEDYHAYGEKILAPADGRVVTVIDGVPDNLPGSMNPYVAVGNCIIIQHTERRFSVLAHLQPSTCRVKAGSRVRQGQTIGRCGNSGNSSEPHIHFHLQDTATLQDGLGITPYFQTVHVARRGTSTCKRRYTPVRGDRVRQEVTC